MGLVCSCSCRSSSRNGSSKQKGCSLLPTKENGQPKNPQKYDSKKLQDSSELKSTKTREKGVSKITGKSPILGRSGTLNLKKAVDRVGRRVSSLKSRKVFVHGMVSRGTKISVLSFEVANTIEKGANLLESLSDRKVGFHKEVLGSEGVQNLVSTDMDLLLMIAAADRREEFDVFLKEVIRFGDLCKHPQWHNLDQYFPKSDDSISNIPKEEAEADATMRELRVIARHTSDLYHESNALDRFEQDYKHKLEEAKSFNLPRRGEDLAMLHEEVKLQRTIVNSLKKKSLWSKNMEEIVAKLVDVLAYLNQRFVEASGNNNGTRENGDEDRTSQRLGPAGLALHYANIIIQIDAIASRPTCLPPNVRDSLYRSLPRGVKTSLRSRLRVVGEDAHQFVVSRVRAEMTKTSKWLVPAATNTIKVHQKFGCVGEWAMSSKEKKTAGETIRLQTLHHADKEKTETYILEQVTWLHHLIKLAKQRVNTIVPLPLRSSTNRKPNLPPKAMQFPPVKYTTLKPMNIYKVSRVCPLRRTPQGLPSSK